MSTARRKTLAVSWAVLIVALCTIPGTDLPEIDIASIDKLAHFSLFAVLAWLWLDATDGPIGRRSAVVLLLGSLFGLATEYYQGLLPWERTPDMLDAAANAVGLMAGTATYVLSGRSRTPR